MQHRDFPATEKPQAAEEMAALARELAEQLKIVSVHAPDAIAMNETAAGEKKVGFQQLSLSSPGLRKIARLVEQQIGADVRGVKSMPSIEWCERATPQEVESAVLGEAI